MTKKKLSIILAIIFALWSIRIGNEQAGFIDGIVMLLIATSLANEYRKL